MEISVIHALTDEQLHSELDNSHRELMNLRFRWSTRQINSHQELRKVKKDIARLKTVIRMREMRES